MTDAEFLSKARTWINHKLILSHVSGYYKNPDTAGCVAKTKDAFVFLLNGNNVSSGQLAILIKRHTEILSRIMPSSKNPAYKTSLDALTELVCFSDEVIKKLNLHYLLNE